jgi:MYND finger
MTDTRVLLDSEGHFVSLLQNGKEIEYSCELDSQEVHPDLGLACWFCQKRKSKKEKPYQMCSNCMQASYCSAECQKEHYHTAHKFLCTKIEEMEEPEDSEGESEGDSEDMEEPIDERIEARGGGFRGGGGGFRGGGGGFRGGGGGFRGGGGVPRGFRGPGRLPGGVMPRRGGGFLPRSSFRTGPWARTWHSNYWSRIMPPLLWGYWQPWYRRWYPSSFWYAPPGYYYTDMNQGQMPLPNLVRPQWRFPPQMGGSQSAIEAQGALIEQLRQQILMDPEVQAVVRSTSLTIVPDPQRGIFVWISTSGPLA